MEAFLQTFNASSSKLPQVLLVEDNPSIRRSVKLRLELEDFEVQATESGEGALELLQQIDPDIVLLDVNLPGIDGFMTAQEIRKTSNIPILMLTARDSLEDRVAGLEWGADGYLVKPFEVPELVARLRALMRRSPYASLRRQAEAENLLEFADISLHKKTRRVLLGEKSVDLTPREFDLLEYFLRHPGQILSRNRILEAVWGYDLEVNSNLVDVYVRQLRIKLEVSAPRRLHTVRGVGYSLRDSER